MLFMPTNIIPDVNNGIGSGTVDVTNHKLNVSWSVNGNSPMTKYRIQIYNNNAASTLVYDTSLVTLANPFYGKDASGVSQRFNATEITLPNDVTNGNEYKLVITQYWSANDYVRQSSASVFITKNEPVLTVSVPQTLSSRIHTFTASYSQTQGDTINWVRWQIAYADDLDNPFYDTQNIYGVQQLSVSYDGFFTGESAQSPMEYAIRCTLETSSGIFVDSDWQTFGVYYSTNVLPAVCTAKRVCGDSTGVSVLWNGFRYIDAESSGDYEINDGILTMYDGTSVYWNKVTGTAMSISTPWNVIYKGWLLKEDATLLQIYSGSTIYKLVYTLSTRTLSCYDGATLIQSISPVQYTAAITAILTPSKLYIRRDEMTGGLYPSTTLYPSESLYPRDDTIPVVYKNNYSLSYTQSAITKIEVDGIQSCDFLQVVVGTLPADLITEIYDDGTYEQRAIDGTYFLADFISGLNAGSLYIEGTTIEGWAIYRQRIGGANIQHIADVKLEVDTLIDYSVRSQQGDYIYYVYPISADRYVTDPIISNNINPCLWNWAILECTRLNDYTYVVADEFIFNKNLSSGDISNNGAPNVMNNFTRYPTVQKSQSNYKSGTLTSLIGHIDYLNSYQYSDSIELRDKIFDLSTTDNYLFLKNRKGDLFQIEIADSISASTNDSSRAQEQTIEIPWVEVGSADGISIVGKNRFYGFEDLNSPEEG